jgi:hypothetical protein
MVLPQGFRCNPLLCCAVREAGTPQSLGLYLIAGDVRSLPCLTRNGTHRCEEKNVAFRIAGPKARSIPAWANGPGNARPPRKPRAEGPAYPRCGIRDTGWYGPSALAHLWARRSHGAIAPCWYGTAPSALNASACQEDASSAQGHSGFRDSRESVFVSGRWSSSHARFVAAHILGEMQRSDTAKHVPCPAIAAQ